MTGLKLHLLGPFRAVVDDVEIEASRIPRKTARLIVKLLALAPGHQMHREQLIEILAPDMDADAGLNRLHKAIHALRSALEPDLAKVAQSRFVLTQDTLVSLASGVRVDVEEFEQMTARALETNDTPSLLQAIALYTGGLLEEDLYEDWTAVHRERLRLMHQRLLGALSANYEAEGDWKTLDICQKLLAAFPADEEAHRRLMRFYANNGQRHMALEQFHQCSAALHQEMDATPEQATILLYESILEGSFSKLQPRSDPSSAAAPVTPVKAEIAPLAVSVPPADGARVRFPGWLMAFTACFAVASLAGLWYLRRPEPPAAISLAILPLRSKPPSPMLDAIADGLTEGLINSTSRMSGLRVMARTTAFSFKSRTDGWQVGRELKVSYVVFGSVGQREDKIDVNLELVDVADGSRAWGRHYTVDRRDAAAIQPLLDSELTAALKAKGASIHPSPQHPQSALDAETYQLYLTGRQLSNQRTPASIKKSIVVYQQAIARNPKYALAFAGLADSYGLLGFQDGVPGEYYPKAHHAAAQALELDPNLAEAQTSLAMVSALYEWNWPAAEAQFRRAIEMNPGYATAHHWLGVHLAARGRFDEAKAELGKALSLDPKSAIVVTNFGYPDLYRRKYSEAQEIFQRAVALSPNLPATHHDLVTVFELQRKPAEAAREWVAFLKLYGLSGLAGRLEPLAARGDFRAVLRESWEAFAAPSPDPYLSPMIPAEIMVRLGDPDLAFRWLDRAFEQRCPQLVYLAVDPKYDPIRQDPRFAALVQRIGLHSN